MSAQEKYRDELRDYLFTQQSVTLLDVWQASAERYQSRIAELEAEVVRLKTESSNTAIDRLDAPAKVGGTLFGVGVHHKTVIDAAKRLAIYKPRICVDFALPNSDKTIEAEWSNNVFADGGWAQKAFWEGYESCVRDDGGKARNIRQRWNEYKVREAMKGGA